MLKIDSIQKATTVVCLAVLAPISVYASVSETIDNASPAAGSVDELAGPIEIAFPADVERPPGRWTWLNDLIADKPQILSDMVLDLNFRTYYFLRDNGNSSLMAKNQAWAAGGTANFESGKFAEYFSVGAEYFLSVPVNAPDNQPGSGLLKPIQDTISVMGQALVRGTFGEQVVTLGRQRIEKPFLNGDESRMLPNTFEAATLDGRWRNGRFFIGYVDKIKTRTSDDFISMGRRAGVAGSDEGLWELGARFEWGRSFIGVITSVVPDILATTYSELDFRWRRGRWGFRIGAQVADQRSIGDDLLTGEAFDTQMFGGRVSADIDNVVFTAAITTNGDGAAFRSPFGGYPGFNSLMLSNFNLANQTTYRLGMSVQGKALGLPWVSGYINYAHGSDAEIALTGQRLPDDNEFDVTLDFKPKGRSIGDAWLRVRYGVLNPGDDRERYNVRVTFNWAFQLI